VLPARNGEQTKLSLIVRRNSAEKVEARPRERLLCLNDLERNPDVLGLALLI
jgi:hypothetical protein